MNDMVNKRIRQRYAWIAVGLSLLTPGLGQVYCGKLTRGLAFILASFVFAFLPLRLISSLAPMSSVLFTVLILAAILVIPIAAMVDAYRLATRTRRDYVPKEYNRILVYVLIYFIAAGSNLSHALHIRDCFLEAFLVPANSMSPTIANGDRVLGNKICYRNADPRRGDLVVFWPVVNRKDRYIKRVVAIAGDTVALKDNELYINGHKLAREKLAKSPEGTIYYEENGSKKYTIQLTDSPDKSGADFAEITVPDHYCFVLGDNRDSSFDSRNFGCVPLATIIARVDYLYWPVRNWSRFGRIH